MKKFEKRNQIEEQIEKLEVDIKHIRPPLDLKSTDWQETADKWIVFINSYGFIYYTGIGHRKTTRKSKYEYQVQHGYKTTRELEERAAKVKMQGPLDELILLTKPKEPSIKDVLYSLAMDSEALECCFKDWCYEFGYSDDSIKAREMYNACQENAFKLKKIGFNLEDLKEYFADY